MHGCFNRHIAWQFWRRHLCILYPDIPSRKFRKAHLSNDDPFKLIKVTNDNFTVCTVLPSTLMNKINYKYRCKLLILFNKLLKLPNISLKTAKNC